MFSEVRSYWQVASVAHYCHIFRDGLKLPKFDYQDLEIALSSPIPSQVAADQNLGFQEDNLLVKIIISLLKGYFNNHSIGQHNWEQYLRKIFDILWTAREKLKSPFTCSDIDPDTGLPSEKILSLNDLNLKQRSEVLYHLCELRLYSDDSSDVVGNLLEDEMRIDEPLGTDSKGYNYWYFHGTRLYRENPEAVKNVEVKLALLEQYHEKQLKKKKEEIIDKILKSRIKEDSPKTDEPVKEPSRKKVKREFIPGERSSSRGKKPVERLTINGSTPKTESSKKDSKYSAKPKSKEVEIVPDPSSSCGVPLSELQEAWTCICDTEQEWIDLTESFSKSKNTAECKFYKLLKQNLLPKVQEVFAEIEKIRQKETRQKLLELAPRRTSSRIVTKKVQQEEEEKKAAEEAESRKRLASQADERRKRDAERQRQEQIKKDREERARHRLAIMEDRAARAAVRQKESHKVRPRKVQLTTDSSQDSIRSMEDSDSDDCGPIEFFLSDGLPSSEHTYCYRNWPQPHVILTRLEGC